MLHLLLALLWLAPPNRAADTLVLPLTRRDGGTRVRGLLRNATLPLHGAVRDYGYFYAELHLGTPPNRFHVIVDTGSTMTYVPCISCGSNCGTHHKAAAFDPKASKTASVVPCRSPLCACGRPSCGCSREDQCTYARNYAEQSTSEGMLVEDVLQLGGQPSMPVVFGCETRETGEIFNQEADGILGLGHSPISLIDQLAGRGVVADTFSLCFGGVEGDGALMLGNVDPALYGISLAHTALVPSPDHPHYYCLQLEGLAVDGALLPLPAATYQQGYGTVLDSGTTFTYLPQDAFREFQKQVVAAALVKGARQVAGPDPKFRDICFGGAPPINRADELGAFFPTMSLHLAGGLNLTLSPLNYLFLHASEVGAYCLGVFDNGAAGTLLGGITFRNLWVQYDRARRRVGFGHAPCQSIGLGHRLCQAGDEGWLTYWTG